MSSSKEIVLIGPPQSIHVQRWRSGFAECGWRVTVVGVDRVRLPKPVALAAQFTRHGAALRAANVIAIHSLGLYALGALAVPRVPIIVFPWGSEVHAAATSTWRRQLITLALRRAERVYVTTTSMAREINALEPDATVIVRSWGVAQEMRPQDDDARQFSPPVSRNQKVIMSVRSVGAVYQTETIVSAFSAALKSCSDLHLVLVSGSVAADRKTAKQQRTLIDSARLTVPAQNLTVVPHRAPGVLREWFRQAQLGVSVPTADQRSSTVLECLAEGLPMVVTDIPAYRELREDGAPIEILTGDLRQELTERFLNLNPVSDLERKARADWVRLNEDRRHLMRLTIEECDRYA